MKTINIKEERTKRLIKEGHALLDQIESDLQHIFNSIKEKRNKKVA